MTLELARKRRDQGDLIEELVEALEGIRGTVTLNHRLAEDTMGIIDIGAFWEVWPAAIRVLAKAKEHDCIPWDDAKDVAQQ